MRVSLPVSEWVARYAAAQADGPGIDVPCGSCTACCRSSYFIHIGPDERDTLRHVPTPLLFPAPGFPKGHVVLGFDENGQCPMLVDDRCSIYEHRPKTCRTFDCRVFAATGISPEEDGKPAIAERVRDWQFDDTDPEEARRLAALRAAAAFLAAHPECAGDGTGGRTAGRRAADAIRVHHLFLALADGTGAAVVEPDPADVAAALRP